MIKICEMWDLQKPRKIVEYTPLGPSVKKVTYATHSAFKIYDTQEMTETKCLFNIV